jgi:hypothetical protein
MVSADFLFFGDRIALTFANCLTGNSGVLAQAEPALGNDFSAISYCVHHFNTLRL